MPQPDYPPAFSQNAISSAIGQINDFAGKESSNMMLKSVAAPASGEQQALANRFTLGEPVPVVITGSRPENPIHFPGLRETMIGAAIVQLVEQIPADNPLREKIKELALELHAFGARKIIETQQPSQGKLVKGRGKKS